MQNLTWQSLLGIMFALAFTASTAAVILTSGEKTGLVAITAIFAGALILVAVLPRVSEITVGPKGIAGKISKLEADVDTAKEQIAEQQKAINTLVAYAMSASIFRHLCGITLLKAYNLDYHETNRRELYFLRDHGFIQPRHGGFLDFYDGGSYNVAQIAEPTPIGTAYVRLRKGEIPPEMRADLKNLRFDISAL